MYSPISRITFTQLQYGRYVLTYQQDHIYPITMWEICTHLSAGSHLPNYNMGDMYSPISRITFTQLQYGRYVLTYQQEPHLPNYNMGDMYSPISSHLDPITLWETCTHLAARTTFTQLQYGRYVLTYQQGSH